jgi:hypothetical protein
MKLNIQLSAKDVIAKLKAFSPKGKRSVTVTVGYSAPHAIYVHENLQMRHPNGGQAKFLEQPARQYGAELAELVATAIRNKEGIVRAVLRAGNRLLRYSQPLVPVDTGELRDSGAVNIVNEEADGQIETAELKQKAEQFAVNQKLEQERKQAQAKPKESRPQVKPNPATIRGTPEWRAARIKADPRKYRKS